MNEEYMREQPDARAPRRRRRKRRLPPWLYIAAIILLCGLFAGTYYAITAILPSRERVEWRAQHPDWAEGTLALMLGNELQPTDARPLLTTDGAVYLPLAYVRETLDATLFADGDDVIITTPTEVLRLQAGNPNGESNGQPMPFGFPAPVLRENDAMYLAADLLTARYHIDIHLPDGSDIVLMDRLDVTRRLGNVIAEKTALRAAPDKHSPLFRYVTAGDALVLYEEAEGWIYARTTEGLTGYLAAKDIAEVGEIPASPAPVNAAPPLPGNPDGSRLNITWDLITEAGAATAANRLEANRGLDVISPTWFSFNLDTLNGDIVSIADRAYTDKAHANGLQVWGLITDNFDARVTADILSDTAKRIHIIEQLLSLAEEYALDGVNIDFEMVRKADVLYYHQFLRELAPMLRARGIVFSVDTYVPMPYSMYYNRGELARIADYVVIFGYDEHNASSEAAGPVGSMPFVRSGVETALAEVLPEKLILGVPFYTRIWSETPVSGGIQLTSRAVGMNLARSIVEENGAKIVWSEGNGCFYAEYTTTADGVTVRHRCWLEDEHSMAERLALVVDKNLAGVASWHKGLEKEEIWDLLYDALGKTD